MDNDLAFAGFKNPGVYFFIFWDMSKLNVDALPARSVERLRELTRKDLDRLAVVEQYEIRDRVLIPSQPGPRREPESGVFHDDRSVQLGLTRSEIDGIERRIRDLLDRVDAGEIGTF